MSMDTEAVVFVYTGPGGDNAPQDIVRVRVDASVTSIPAQAFRRRKKLAEVELCEGLVEIGDYAFYNCDHSITMLIIPNSLRRINYGAFSRSLRCPIRLHDGIESIGAFAFASCIFTNFRVPPLITVIPGYMLSNCNSTFSVEIPLTITEIENNAFWYCHSLRNVAIPPNADVGYDIFRDATDLLQLFGSELEIIRQLKHRFDGLRVHSSVYVQSYNQEVLQRLITSCNELDPTGNQQDCLGMTPLHILACSSVHNLEMYRLIVEKYLTNLITVDAWGAVPLLYAIWGDAPIEIVNFLIDSYRSLYPAHEFDWTDMVITLGRANAPVAVIKNLLDIQHTLSLGYNIDWVQILEELARATPRTEPFASSATFCFLTRCSIATRVSAIGVKHFCDNMADNWMGAEDDDFDREMWHNETLTKLEYYESEYENLKETTSLMELALWKMNIDASTVTNSLAMGDNNRLECRTNCGADFVIENVLPYLLPSDFVRSYIYISDEEDSDSNNDNDEDDDVEDDSSNNDEDNEDNDDGWEE
jgi:hypothetical protein